MPANLRLLLEKHGLDFLQAALQQVVGEPASMLNGDEYTERVTLEAWRHAPMQLRLLSPQTIRWNEFCLAIRPRVFDVSTGAVKLRSGWRAEVSQVAEQFGGEANEDALDAGAALVDDGGVSMSAETAELLLGDAGSAGRSGVLQPAIGIDLGTTYSVV